MKNIVILGLIIFLMNGCVSTKSQNIFIDKKITTDKIVSIEGTRTPWVFEIEKRLRKEGFKVKRFLSQNVSVEQVTSKKTIAYNEASSKYLLRIDGYAPNSSMTRCMGGGYIFDYIDVELIDLVNNETIFHYHNSGYSEQCPPVSGTIFADITNLVANRWK